MKALFTEDYYRNNWDKFLQRVPGEDYINLEGELNYTMGQWAATGMVEAALPIIKKMEAKNLVERCLKLVKKEMETIKQLERGTVSFGMINKKQEIQARADFRKRFEFNCLQLADFRKAYNV